ncbi:helix-turn-helix transcriptional regulator [Micromonospora polyrhachis]|uniref:Transcriptional regulator with XRE-family HTH domain n=1 Tax=Micromonospora polyrhachis TaxID=1282883 RepID=A0A7W7SP44_9ACTN|nr:helix-turn-helix transcriptional regulator [Micromonospora polyrhachis]MBB4958394.1 transcriptional regulator with XRE-family HTH domain [Micromonospora polyrhachis]
MSGNQTGSGRATLGARLRELRAREGMSGVMLAARLGWVQSKVSRIETGRQVPTGDEVRAWAEATQADDSTVDELLQGLRTLRTAYIPWRRGSGPHQSGGSRSAMELAAEATLVRNFEVGVVPGLLQTADYARVRLAEEVGLRGAPADDLEHTLLLRIQRQQVLYDSTKKFQFVVTESVLRMLLCPVEVMRGQLDRLAALIGMGNVDLGVIPTSVLLPVAPLHGFVMFDDAITIETWAEGQLLQSPADISRFRSIFNRLHGIARHGEAARHIILDALTQLRPAA